MPAWLAGLIASATTGLTGIKGALIKALLNWGGKALGKWLSDIERNAKQKQTEKKVEEDIKSEAPRSEETKKHEKDWMNS